MAKTKQAARVYQRDNGRWYVDIRSYADVLDGKTGRHVALVAPNEKLATTDALVARKLAAQMVDELEARRRGVVLVGRAHDATLGEFAGRYLVVKKQDGRVGDELLTWSERIVLPRAIKFFGADRPLASIDVARVKGWVRWLGTESVARKHQRKPLSEGTIRKHINVLSNLYRYAQQEGVVAPGTNPVALLMAKPQGASRAARWLDHDEASRLLTAAQCEPRFPVLATLLLTGARKTEVLGLAVEDIDLKRGVIHFRPNGWRRLKNKMSTRSVPLWPQLRAILSPHVERRRAEAGDTKGALLFPTVGAKGQASMITDMRKALARVLLAAGFEKDRVHLHGFRHTYCAARLQTLDNGKPISPFTVARELGHGGDAMIKQVYGHLGDVRHRAEVVEFLPTNEESKKCA